jgi:hypothetical protein
LLAENERAGSHARARHAGFFENADADAKARGEAPKKKRTREEEYSAFMTSIAEDVKEVEAREEEEAAEAAADRAARELFEQRCANFLYGPPFACCTTRIKRQMHKVYDAVQAAK